MNNSEFVYFQDNFLSLQQGKPIRLLPVGRLVKNGKAHELTKEFLAKFKLPHFKPPVKLGSHNDETPAGGFITKIELRDDGLYGFPEWTEQGKDAFEKGNYRYHSPEIIWENGGFENPETGDVVQGPMIVGLALLHTPHLGERAALYSIESLEVGKMAEQEKIETVEVPKSFFESFMAMFKRDADPVDETEQIKADEFAAVKKERDDFEKQLAEVKAAEEKRKERDELNAVLQDEKYGEVFKENSAALDHFMTMQNETRDWVLQQFAALTAQINEGALTGEFGSDGDGKNDTALDLLNAEIKKVQDEQGMNYSEALRYVAQKNPDIVAKYQQG